MNNSNFHSFSDRYQINSEVPVDSNNPQQMATIYIYGGHFSRYGSGYYPYLHNILHSIDRTHRVAQYDVYATTETQYNIFNPFATSCRHQAFNIHHN